MSAVRDHSRFDELAVGWALYALEPDDEQVFVKHLTGCERCRRTVRETQETLATVTLALPCPEPPARLLDRIYEAIGAPARPQPIEPSAVEQSTVEQSTVEQPAVEQSARPGAYTSRAGDTARRTSGPAGDAARHRRGPATGRRDGRRPAGRSLARRLSQLAVAAVLVIVVGGLAGWNIVSRNNYQHQEQVAAQHQVVLNDLIAQSRVATLTDHHGKRVGDVVNQNGTLGVVSDGLPANNRSTSTYALWSVSAASGTPRLVGTFDVTNADLGVRTVGSVPSGMDHVTTMAVSKEPGRATPTRPTTIVASGAVRS